MNLKNPTYNGTLNLTAVFRMSTVTQQCKIYYICEELNLMVSSVTCIS